MLNVDPVWLPDTQQAHFRLLLDAMARPGRIHTLTQPPQQGAAFLGVLATLLDNEVTLADPDRLLHDADWPMLQARPATVEQADYILCDGRHQADINPRLGTLASPERSATLILQVTSLCEGELQLQLRGPGIKDQTRLHTSGLHLSWLQVRENWVADFPLGVDIILVDDHRIAALPRTTRVEVR